MTTILRWVLARIRFRSWLTPRRAWLVEWAVAAFALVLTVIAVLTLVWDLPLPGGLGLVAGFFWCIVYFLWGWAAGYRDALKRQGD